MSEKTTGILLCAHSRACYGYAAFNLAASIKFLSPSVHITLMCDGEATREYVDDHRRVFDSIVPINYQVGDPGIFKVSIYDKLPYDYTLFLDVDALAIMPVEPLLEKLVSEYEADPDGKYFRCHVHAWYDSTSPDDMPMMYWATRSVIWNQYGFNDSHRLPGTQSSMQFIAKCEKAEQFFLNVQRTMVDDPVPINMLKHRWGGTQPDELYLNIEIARAGITPDIHGAMWFCDNSSKRPFQLQQEGCVFLSYFGVKERIKSHFMDYYNKQPVIFLRKMGYPNHYWKFHNVFQAKHAANKVKPITRAAPVAISHNVTPAPIRNNVKHLTTHLFTTYYKAKTESRQRELLTCLMNNVNNPYIDRVVVASEIEIELYHEKLTVIRSPRLTFRELVDIANEKAGEINIITNTDIFCDETINQVSAYNLSGKVLCLCRHDIIGQGRTRLIEAEYSQDAWIWAGELNFEGGNYLFGILGCDNVFAYELNKAGYQLHNPSRDIKTLHLHLVNERYYSEATRLPRPYLHVPVSTSEGLLKKRMLINQPGKVGDIIRCLPIAKHYSSEYDVEWLAPKQYASMFDYVDYVKHVTEAGTYDRIIDLSFGLNQKTDLHRQWLKERSNGLDSFLTLKYRIAEVPVSECFNLNYQRNEKRESDLYNLLGCGSGDGYILTHTNSDYGSAISVDSVKRVVEFKPVDGFTIFDWRKVIESASEIHAIDSSLVNFADVCNPSGKLFYYITDKVPAKADRTLLQKEWTIINQLEYAHS